MSNKKLFFVICSLILFLGLSNNIYADQSYSGTIASLTSVGNETITLTNVIITGPVNITGPNVIINVTGTLALQGASVFDGASTDAITIQSNFTRIDFTGPSLYMRNVRVTNSGGAGIRSYPAAAGNTITLEKVSFNTSSYAMDIRNLILSSRFSRFTNTGGGNLVLVNFNASGAALPAPVFEFCSFGPAKAGVNYHLILSAAAGYAGGTANLEGSYFVGGPNIGASNMVYDNAPASTSGDPLGTTGATALQCAGGTFSWGKIIPKNTHVAFNSSVTIPSGQTWRVGYDERNITYSGGSGLYFANITGLTVQNGGSLTSTGTSGANNIFSRISAGQWNGINLQAGAISSISYSRFSNASPQILDQSAATIQNNTFGGASGAGTIGLQVNTTAGGTYSNNSFDTIGYGISTNVNCTMSGNTFTGINTSAINISGGTPVIQLNTMSSIVAPGKALTITSGSFPANNVVSNNFANVTGVVSATGATGVVNLSRNYWGALNPSVTNVTGTDEIQYEPWLNAAAPGGAVAYQAPTVVNRTTIIPADGANLATIPTAVTFDVYDLGYHNGTPLQYYVRIYDQSGTLLNVPAWTGAVPGPGATVSYPLGFVPAIGNTYYWDAQVQNTQTPGAYQYSPFPSPSFNFSIQKPDLGLTLSASTAQASAGDTVTYTINFRNNSASALMNNSTITSVLPNEVYFNGTISLQGITAGMLNVIVTAYDGSGAALGTVTVSAAGTTTITNATGGWVSAANNALVRRLTVNIAGTLNPLAGGQVIYNTIVK